MFWQIVPSMYNFANEIWISKDPLNEALPERTLHLWVNHYPLRTIYFTNNRRKLSSDCALYHVKTRSQYREQSMESFYKAYFGPAGLEIRKEGPHEL